MYVEKGLLRVRHKRSLKIYYVLGTDYYGESTELYLYNNYGTHYRYTSTGRFSTLANGSWVKVPKSELQDF